MKMSLKQYAELRGISAAYARRQCIDKKMQWLPGVSAVEKIGKMWVLDVLDSFINKPEKRRKTGVKDVN
jgi:hypothetical protein